VVIPRWWLLIAIALLEGRITHSADNSKTVSIYDRIA
jgi:hypothetical protein